MASDMDKWSRHRQGSRNEQRLLSQDIFAASIVTLILSEEHSRLMVTWKQQSTWESANGQWMNRWKKGTLKKRQSQVHSGQEKIMKLIFYCLCGVWRVQWVGEKTNSDTELSESERWTHKEEGENWSRRASAKKSLNFLQSHPHLISRTDKCDNRFRIVRWVRWSRRRQQFEFLDHLNESESDFIESESFADAITWSKVKRHESILMKVILVVRHESLWIESIWITPILGMSMKSVDTES